jgi:hypothetical protein
MIERVGKVFELCLSAPQPSDSVTELRTVLDCVLCTTLCDCEPLRQGSFRALKPFCNHGLCDGISVDNCVDNLCILCV